MDAFAKLRREIDETSGEYDIRQRLVDHFIKGVLGYSGKEYQTEKSRADLTIFDENGFRILVIETKSLSVDVDKDELKDYAFKYADPTTKYVGLTNGSKFKLWEIIGRGRSALKVDLDFGNILERDKPIAKHLSTRESSQILYLGRLRKEVLYGAEKYKDFDTYYGEIDVKEDAGFRKLLERLEYIITELLREYTFQAFDEYKAGYSQYLSELRKIDDAIRTNKGNEELLAKLEKEKSDVENKYRKYLPFRGYEAWKKFSGRDDVSDEENKEIFCKETIYVLINKLLFIRICEDKGLLPSNISNGGIETLKKTLYEPEESYKDVLNLAYRNASKLYGHFYELGVLDWYVEGDGELNNVLNRVLWILNRFNFANVDRDILGKLYEKYLPREERKNLGQFYTPDPVIDYILDSVGYTPENEIEGKDLLDPACGSGGFLVRAMNRLIERYRRKGLAPKEILNNVIKHIYGFDINAFACHIAEMNLLFQVIDLYQEARKQDKSFPLKRFNIYQTDSLERASAQKEVWQFVNNRYKVLAKEREETEAIKRKKFDFVVGNPPFIRTMRMPKKELYRDLYPDFVFGQFDISYIFVGRGIQWLKRGGKFGYITSNKFCVLDSGINLRKYILKNCKIKKFIDLSGVQTFAKTLPSSAIVIFERVDGESMDNKIEVDIKRQEDLTPELRDGKGLEDMEEALTFLLSNVNPYYVTQERFYKNDDYLFDFSLPDDVIGIIEKIEKQSAKLIPHAVSDIRRGLRPDTTKYKDEKFFISSKEYKDLPLAYKNLYRKLIRGEDITDKYRLRWSGEYVKFKPEKMAEGAHADLYECPKIVIKEIGKRLRAAYDDENFYCYKTLHIIRDVDASIDLEYLTAFLNSKLVDFYNITKFYLTRLGRGSFRFREQFLKKLPIKLPRSQKEKVLVDQIIQNVAEINNLNKKLDEIEAVGADFTRLLGDVELQPLSDSPSIIFNIGAGKVTDIKREENKIFLNKGSYIECGEEKVADYLEFYLKTIEEELKRSTVPADIIFGLKIPKNRKEIEVVVEKYGKLLRKLKDIPQRVVELKETIDKQIFKLYGLSGDEIATIESKIRS